MSASYAAGYREPAEGRHLRSPFIYEADRSLARWLVPECDGANLTRQAETHYCKPSSRQRGSRSRRRARRIREQTEAEELLDAGCVVSWRPRPAWLTTFAQSLGAGNKPTTGVRLKSRPSVAAPQAGAAVLPSPCGASLPAQFFRDVRSLRQFSSS